MSLQPLQSVQQMLGSAYIAGRDDGIVTVDNVASERYIYLFDVRTLQLIRRTKSLPNGRYMFMGLDSTKQYLIIARDYMRNFEPACYDFVTPSSDLNLKEQMELWNSWQVVN